MKRTILIAAVAVLAVAAAVLSSIPAQAAGSRVIAHAFVPGRGFLYSSRQRVRAGPSIPYRHRPFPFLQRIRLWRRIQRWRCRFDPGFQRKRVRRLGKHWQRDGHAEREHMRRDRLCDRPLRNFRYHLGRNACVRWWFLRYSGGQPGDVTRRRHDSDKRTNGDLLRLGNRYSARLRFAEAYSRHPRQTNERYGDHYGPVGARSQLNTEMKHPPLLLGNRLIQRILSERTGREHSSQQSC